MIPRLLLLLPLALAACSPGPGAGPDRGQTLAAADPWRPELPEDHGPILREDLPPPPGARGYDPTFAAPGAPAPEETPGLAGHDEIPPPPEPPAPAADTAADQTTWTPLAVLPGIPERRQAVLTARAELEADCAGHVPPADLPFATPWIQIAHGRIAAAAEGEGAPMLYLRDPDGAWHCGLLRAEAPARPGRWHLHVGTLLENAPVPPVRVRLEHAAP